MIAKSMISPALPDVRPAPQAGCFVSRLDVSKDSAQITLRHRVFGTVAGAPSSASCTGSFGSRLFEDGERFVAMFGEVLLALDGTVPPASMAGEGGVSQGGEGLGGAAGAGAAVSRSRGLSLQASSTGVQHDPSSPHKRPGSRQAVSVTT